MKKNKISRRSFLLMTGTTGVGGIFFTHEFRKFQNFVPYVNPPDYPKPGEWSFYPTSCRECPAGCGMVMWHRDGRVTKAEGNPFHPINKGKLCIRGQSSVQGLYNSGRIAKVLKKGKKKGDFSESNWNEALSSIKKDLQTLKPVIISDLQTGSLAGVLDEFAASHNTKCYYYEAFNYESLRQATKEVFDSDLIPRFDITHSDLIISFNADFLETWLSPVEYAGDFSQIHSPDREILGHFIYFGPSETLTAANADQFIVTPPDSLAAIINRISSRLREKGGIRNPTNEAYFQTFPSLADTTLDPKIIEEVTDKILKAKSPVILTGRPEDYSFEGTNAVKAAYFLNDLLGNRNRLDFSQYHALSLTAYRKDIDEALQTLTDQHILFIHHTNPFYSIPGIENYLKKAAKIIYIGPEKNETIQWADWVLPSNYTFEEWGDYEPWKGTVSLIQPLMKPLFDSRSAGDIFLELMISTPSVNSYKNLVRSNWEKWLGELNHAQNAELMDENIRKSHLKRQTAENNPVFSRLLIELKDEPKLNEKDLFLNVVPSLIFYDGRLANRPWLQEIPEPITSIVWQSWADLHPKTAALLNIHDGEMIKVIAGEVKIEIPVRLTTKTAERTLSILTGQGHWSIEAAGDKVGFNVYALQNKKTAEFLPIISIENTGQMQIPLYLNNRGEQYGRELLKTIEIGKISKSTTEDITLPLPQGFDKEHDLYRQHPHKEHRWAMVIDLQSCIGCKACEAACYAENNIPVMGRADCKKGLEMSWLKVPEYEIGDDKIAFIPLPCQHCDAAPCEPVCPVYAASHTDEGLNAQIYNRCVGTRYCSNNCPYKVRRFNWKNIKYYNDINVLQLNPEVSVRRRGVMEKCTFCVQRIRYVEYAAKKAERKIKDGEIIPACAQTCPTNAILFGDLLDPDSKVTQLFNHERRYQLLRDFNTKPAVVYLKKIVQGKNSQV